MGLIFVSAPANRGTPGNAKPVFFFSDTLVCVGRLVCACCVSNLRT
jgi:hypothetical protein